MRRKIVFYLNGKRQELGAAESSMMLAEYLRYEKGLTGTKIVCAEGDCGACSVLRYFPHVQGTDAKNYLPINSCITMVAQLDGSSIVTVDALKDKNQLSEAQKAMVTCHGSQCGFCTPGFVIALTGLMEEKLAKNETSVSVVEAKNCLTGNLCRCTGYGPIIDAAVTMNLQDSKTIKELFYSEKQEADLILTFNTAAQITGEGFEFYAPKTIEAAVTYLLKDPEVRIMGGASDLGVIHNKRKISLTKILSLHLIKELYQLTSDKDGIFFGARVTHTEFRHFVKDKVPEFARYLDVFASPQIKNIGTLVGNIANASPIGDTPPALLALEAKAVIFGPNGQREVPLSKFFLAYRKTSLEQGDIITGIKFPTPHKDASIKFYKNSNRKDLDISAVNLAVNIRWKDKNKKIIENITIAAGGVAATPLRFLKTEESLKKNFDIEDAVKILHSEFNPLSDVRATAAYRHVLVENLFRRFFKEEGV